MSQRSEEADVRRAFAFLGRLASLEGTPAQVIPEVRALAREQGLAEAPVDELERVLDLLAAYGHDPHQVRLNLGLGRGLHYYTGILFEVYDPQTSLQLSGGGRYDDLAQLLGARQPLPACGFSCGLERLVERVHVDDAGPRPAILVVPAYPEAVPAAIRETERLRAEGQIVELEVRGRSLQAARRYAERAGIEQVLVIDPPAAAQDAGRTGSEAITGNDDG